MNVTLRLKSAPTLRLRYQPGLRGPTGLTGSTGPTGPANTLTIGTVTALDFGDPAEATITGTPPNQVLNLGLPAGEQGPSGSVSDGDKGDIVVSGGGTVWTIEDGAVDYDKLAAVAEDRSQAGYKIEDVGDATADTDALNRQTADARYRAVGQCRLTKVSSNIVLSPWNGNILVIDGNAETIPSAGVSLAPSGLTPSTLYYIYAYMSTGTMTLEASTTAAATDTSTGMKIKTGDATRTLVGMVRPIFGPAFVDTAAQRLVKSWFNPLEVAGSGSFTAGRTVSAGSYAEANTEIRNEFLTWANEVVRATFTGSWQSTGGATTNYLAIAFDGTKSGGALQSSTTLLLPAALATSEALTEGYHYATLIGKVSSANYTLASGTDGCYLQTVTRS
jgi:hypothetical protein